MTTPASAYPIWDPTNQTYIQPFTQFNQLTYNTENCTIVSGNVSATTTPNVHLDGCGRAYLRGNLTVTVGSPAANYNLLNLPSNIVPNGDWYFPVSVLRAGAYVSNCVKISGSGNVISSVTITAPGNSTTIPTFTTTGSGTGATFTAKMKVVADPIATGQSGAGSYAPAEVLTISGGTSTTAATLTVSTTQVISATVAAGGSGGTNGTQTVTGTTGTGTKFQASVTVAGGAITAVLSISVAGNYTVNPTSLTAEPVTGASLTGAQLNIKMGVLTAAITNAGAYSVLPSNPVATTSGGSGTGATFTLGWGLQAVTVTNGGSDYTSASGITVSTGGGTVVPVLGASSAGLVTLVNAPNQNDVVKLDTCQFLVKSYTS